jgi:CRISPR/Cas system-associated endoribonuclease Cas2
LSEVSFEVKQDVLAKIQNSVIEANFDECKAALTEMIQPYASLIVTEDGLAAAKADRAKIRKVEAHIGDMRIDIKKAYMKPYDEFAN